MGALKTAKWLGASLTLMLASLVSMGEIGRIISGIPVGGNAYRADSLYNVLQVHNAGTAMHAWAVLSCSGSSIRWWLFWHLLLDVPFIVGYVGLALGLNQRWTLKYVWGIVALAAFDVIEDVLTGIGIAQLPTAGAVNNCAQYAYHVPALFTFLMLATIAKTVLMVALVVRVIWVIATNASLRQAAWTLVRAVSVQRFHAIVLLFLSVLLLLPGKPVLEQGIDVERSWVLSRHHGDGITSAAWAVLAFVVLAAVLRYVASIRVAPFQVHPAGTPPPTYVDIEPPGLAALRAEAATTGLLGQLNAWRKAAGLVLVQGALWWLASAVAIGLIAASGLIDGVRIYWRAVIVIAAVLVSVPLLGAALALAQAPPIDSSEDLIVRRKAFQVGRAMSWAIPIVLLLSCCRALIAPLMVLPTDRLACGVIAALCALLACLLAYQVLATNAPKLRPASKVQTTWKAVDPQLVGARKATGPAAAAPEAPGIALSVAPALAVTLLAGGVLLVFPAHVARAIGLLGVIGAGLLVLTGFYAVLQILSQLTDPPHVFRVLRLRAVPVVTLVLVISTISSILMSDSSLHQTRRSTLTDTASSADSRPTLSQAFANWQKAGQDTSATCALSATTTSGRSVRVRPLLLVAAEGGGIRAAWWTVNAMTPITSTACGRASLFLTSGVSGGAVGLAVMARTGAPHAAVTKLADQDALAAASDALLLHDQLAGAFGIDVAAADGPSDAHFPDRAALMEHEWERQVPELARPFPASEGTGAPWHTVFNSTSVSNHCRVLVADVQLLPKTASCNDENNVFPGAYDLLSARSCDRGIRTSTAALLASRFPYVTPSGVIATCDEHFTFADQLIDGGYSENSGIDTLISALTQLMPQVRAANAAALAADGDRTVTVPVVVFLHNSVTASAGDLPKSPKARPEPYVPPTNLGDSGVLGKTSTLLARAGDIAHDWVPTGLKPGDDQDLLQAVTTTLRSQTMTVAPQQRAQIALPLGWALSTGTETTLDNALRGYLECDPAKGEICTQSAAFDALLRAWHTQIPFPLDQH